MESSFDFVSRLMEEEGIFYFFQHIEGKHTMVLADDAGAFETCTGVTSIRMANHETDWTEENSILSCYYEQQVTVGQFKSDDYNFETPNTDLLVKADAKDAARSLYHYPGGRMKKDPAEEVAGKRLAALQVPGKTLCGESPCRAFRSGYKFKLEGHTRPSLNAEFVLKQVSHHGDQTSRYNATFEAFPAETKFHPPHTTPKVRIPGAQTATVVGKSGEEIWTDQYGRVKVKFHWDQAPAHDETSSCWIRVAQGWAGKQWGSVFVPRIGQEVVVSFIEGDPDRPLITGCVYNAQQTVPYPLPDDQTKSTIKSNSSKGGSGFNEIRFEDKKNSEELFIQAQKDMKTVVLNDQTSTIKMNRKTTVEEKDDTLIVEKGNRTIKVNSGMELHDVKGSRTLTITSNEQHSNKANFTHSVTGDYTLSIGGNLKIEVGGDISIKSGKSVSTEAGMSIASKAGQSIENNAGMSMTNKAGVSLTNQAGATQTVDGGGMLTLKGGMVKIN
jgi:type VI secretion system secreted protein VgrG